MIALKKLHNIISWREVFVGDNEIFDEVLLEYLEKRKSFSDVKKLSLTLKPKHVWVSSYGRLASQSGSVIQLSTQMGEQKNAVIKGHSQKAKNTKNVLETICKCEKEKSALRNSVPSTSRSFHIEASVDFDDLDDDIKNFISDQGSLIGFSYSSRVSMCGYKFRKDANSCIHYGHPRNPALGLIRAIAINAEKNMLYFVLQKMSISVCQHLDLLTVERLSNFVWLPVDHMVCGRPINIYKSNDHGGNEINWCMNLYNN